ncbi:MAG: NnrS family protein [Emcibacter sp.]|nr:NnrS family protein [Emcibacter sp.]
MNKMNDNPASDRSFLSNLFSGPWFSGPLWQSAFRPFYLFGVLYGLGIMAIWILTTLGIFEFTPSLYGLSLWHGHEMVFGFSGAVVTGFILTALPGWAGTKEIEGWRLALLVLLWFLGRFAVYSGDFIPPYGVLLLDSSLYFVAALMVLPGLLANDNKHYLALLPIFLMFGIGNVIFHQSVMAGDLIRASWAIQIGLMAIVVKFILAGGFLTVIFTGNALRQKNGPELTINPLLEYVSAASLVLFVYGVLADVPEKAAGIFALITAAVQTVRFLRWRTTLILDAPLVLIMHLAYLWFIAALILYGAAAFTEVIGPQVWLHAFTVGALSLMMLSLITRVALRHTGRPMVPAKAMTGAFALMFVVAFLRVMVALGLLSEDWLPVTAVIWWVAFALYLIFHGLFLIRPALPKKAGQRKKKGRTSELGVTS